MRAIDVQREAVANALTNAFRNGVLNVVDGSEVDLFAWVPEARYDVVVASLYQIPVDPRQQMGGHRPLDYWGRNLFDHLIGLLPNLIDDGGALYLMHTSVLSQVRTAELLEEVGFASEVVDFGFFGFTDPFTENLEQIQRVEEQSDAYHLAFGDHHEMVFYLLKCQRK